MSEAPAETPGAPAEAPAGTTPATPPAAPAPAPETPQEQQGKTYDEAYVKRLHDSEAAARVKARDAEAAAQAKIDAALAALGLKPDADTDPVKLAEQAAAERDAAAQTAKEASLHLAVYKAATKAGADADALLDSNSFRSTIGQVDPADAAAVQTAIEEAVKANPKFRLVQVAGASGANFNGGSGESAITQERFNAMGVAERTELFQTNPALYRTLSGR